MSLLYFIILFRFVEDFFKFLFSKVHIHNLFTRLRCLWVTRFRWCRWCVMARRDNVMHKSLPPSSRDVPLLMRDYRFIKPASDDRWLAVLVGRLGCMP